MASQARRRSESGCAIGACAPPRRAGGKGAPRFPARQAKFQPEILIPGGAECAIVSAERRSGKSRFAGACLFFVVFPDCVFAWEKSGAGCELARRGAQPLRFRPRVWPTRLTLIPGVTTPGPPRRSVIRRGPGAPKRPEPAWSRAQEGAHGSDAAARGPVFLAFQWGKKGAIRRERTRAQGARAKKWKRGPGGKARSARQACARPGQRGPLRLGVMAAPAALRRGAKKWGKSRISLHKTGKLPYNLHLSSGALENISVFQRLWGKADRGRQSQWPFLIHYKDRNHVFRFGWAQGWHDAHV